MDRNGRDGRLVSQVNMLPLAWPPAIVVWSAETAMDVMEPDSTAEFCVSLIRSIVVMTTASYRPFVPGPMIILRFWL